MARYQVKAYTLFEDFEAVSSWTIGTGTAIDDTTIYKTGTQSIKLTSTSGGNCNITKTINSDMSTAGVMYYWIYIATGDLAAISDVQLLLSNDAGFTNYYTYQVSKLHEGWNRIQMGRTSWTATGSPSWSTNMVRIRVRVNANTSLIANINVDSIYTGGYNRPKIVMTFDDGFDTQYSEAYAYMKKYRMRGTCYLISDRIGVDAGVMTVAMCNIMYAAGWDMSNHTKTHTSLSTYSSLAENATEIASCDTFLRQNGWTRNNCHKHLAYPFGAYTTTYTLPAVLNAGVLSARTTYDRTQSNEMDNSQLITRRAPIHTTLLATALSWIDTTIADGGTLIMCVHKLTSVPADQNEWGISDFQAFIDYAQSKRDQIDVVPLTEWYQGLSGGRKSAEFSNLA